MEAIILAGGLGTRLRSVVSLTPKCMAPIAGRPFLAFLLDYLASQSFSHVILSVGYLQEQIVTFFGYRYSSIELTYAPEQEPLGTGGAVRLALSHARAGEIFVLNGDTFLALDYPAMYLKHTESKASLSIATAELPDTSRYGRVRIKAGHVVGFLEKDRNGPGTINAGVYCMNRNVFADRCLPRSFSFETEFLHPFVDEIQPVAFPANEYFIDIGIPKEFERAALELPRLSLERRR